MSRIGSESGQASVEAVGVVPALILAALVGWQLILAGHTLWLCAGAARAGARAELVGDSPGAAVRSALPKSLERGLSVERSDGGAVRVEVQVPILLHAWQSPVRVAAVTALRSER